MFGEGWEIVADDGSGFIVGQARDNFNKLVVSALESVTRSLCCWCMHFTTAGNENRGFLGGAADGRFDEVLITYIG